MIEVTTALTDLAGQTCARAGFEALIIADQRGVPLASARAPGTSSADLRRLAELVAETLKRPDDRPKLSEGEPGIFYDWQGRQVIFRGFVAGRQLNILAVLAPKRKAYKRATNRLIRQPKKLLDAAVT